MFGKHRVAGNYMFALNPASNTHGVLINNLTIDQPFAVKRGKPLPRFFKHIRSAKLYAASLLFEHVISGIGRIGTFHLRRIRQVKDF